MKNIETILPESDRCRTLRTTEEFNSAMRRRAYQPYEEFLLTPYWQDVRSLVLRRDKYCQACGSHELLQVHHKTYEHRGDELRHLEDLTTLCEQCHINAHTVHQKEA